MFRWTPAVQGLKLEIQQDVLYVGTIITCVLTLLALSFGIVEYSTEFFGLDDLLTMSMNTFCTLRKVLARKACSSAECTEASEESNQEQILWAWSQVVRWSKNLYSASWKAIHSGELETER